MGSIRLATDEAGSVIELWKRATDELYQSIMFSGWQYSPDLMRRCTHHAKGGGRKWVARGAVYRFNFTPDFIRGEWLKLCKRATDELHQSIMFSGTQYSPWFSEAYAPAKRGGQKINLIRDLISSSVSPSFRPKPVRDGIFSTATLLNGRYRSSSYN
jgi:hypothetical protein